MAAVSPVASASDFLDALEKSQLLSSNALAAVRKAAEKTADPKQLARVLVKDAVLTKWQAAQLLHGFRTLVIGKYKLLDQLGSGALGRVYLAEHAQMGRRHTLKIVSRRFTADAEALKQFLTEAQRVGGLDHRNLSRLYDVDQDGERYYLVMEYAEGEDLQRMVERKGRLSSRRSCDYVLQAATGLAHAHERGVFHGDIKPSNLLIDRGGTLKILDLGQARLAQQPPSGDDDSSSNSPVGAMFLAPEQRGPAGTIDSRTDVYSLGSVLCFVLTGRAAADAPAAKSELAKIDGLSFKLADLCLRMMASDPDQRPASMTAVAREIAAFESSVTSSASASPPPPKKGDSSSGKMRVPKATALEEEQDTAGEPVVIITDDTTTAGKPAAAQSPAEEPSAEQPSPFAALKFDSGSRGRTRSPKATSPAEVEAPASDESPAPPKSAGRGTSKGLLIGGAVGGAVLVLAGAAALVAYLLLRDRGSGPVAEAASQPPAATAPAPADDVESNPAEANPEPQLITPAAAEVSAVTAGGAEAALPQGEAAGGAEAPTGPEASAAPAPQAAPTEPPPAATAETNAQPAGDAQPADDGQSAKVAEAADKPAPANEPPPNEPEPAKPAPKRDVDPFAGFAAAVSLPVLPEGMAPPPEVLAPVDLGPCKVAPSDLVIAHLKGGETVFRSKQKFDLQAVGGTALQDWEVRLLEGNDAKVIATLGVKEDQLVFQWTEAAAAQAATANLLRNCAVSLAAGPKTLVLPLREPVTGPPLVFDLNRPAASVRWSLDHLPQDVKQIYIEPRKLDVEHQRIQPVEGTIAGDEVTIWTGPAEDALYFGLRCDTSATTRYVDVRGTAQVKIEGVIARPKPFNRRELGGLIQQADQQIAFLGLAGKKAEEAEKDAERKKRIRTSSEQQRNAIDTQAQKLRRLLEFTAEFTPTIHFRVYYLADEHQVDLLVTEAAEEPAEKAEPRRPTKGKAEKAKAEDSKDIQ